VVNCPGGCAVRLDENDIVGWWKHIQKTHPKMLDEWLKKMGIWDGKTPMPTKEPKSDRLTTLSSV
jgi:hypothetical protein